MERHQRRELTVSWVTVLLLVFALAASVQHCVRLDELQAAIHRQQQGRQTVTTTWELADGTGTHAVTTERNPGESDADFRLRHFQAVEFAQQNGYPPK